MLRRTLKLNCFVSEVLTLKHKNRGKAQYSDAQAAALKCYQENLPVGGDLREWLNEERATTALNGAQFFEISFQQLPVICEYARDNLKNFTIKNKLLCGIALCHSQKGDVDMDHKSFVKMDIIPDLIDEIGELETQTLQNVSKLLQRSGCTEEKYWSKLCDEIVDRRLDDYRALPPHHRDSAFIRIVAGTARFCPEHKINEIMIDELLRNAKHLKSFDFSSLCASVQRLHHKVPQKPEVLERMLRRASSGTIQFTCRDLASILKSLVKLKMEILGSGVDMQQQVHIELAFKTAIRSLEPVVARFVDKAHSKYWSNAGDVVTVFFSLEAADGLSTGPAMANFSKYICDHSIKLSAFETAVAMGVLRRTGNLNEPVLSMLAQRAAQLVDDFSIDELAHVASTLATRKNSDQWPWLAKLEERISTILEERTGAVTRMYLTTAFPDHQLVSVDDIDFQEVPPRQAIDCLSLVKKGSPLWMAIVQSLNQKFESDAVFSATDVRRCSMIDFDGAIHKRAQAYMVRRLQDEQWRHDTIKLLCLVKDAAVRDSLLGKAVEQAEAIFLHAGPLHLYHAVSKLVDTFGTKSLQLRDFVRAAGDRLVQAKGPGNGHALLQFAGLVTRHKELVPDAEWVEYFIFNPISARVTKMSCSNIIRVLELLEAHQVPLDKKFTEAVEIMVKCALENSASSSNNDEMTTAILLATAMRLKSGAELPKDAINAALSLSWLSEDLRADLRGQDRSEKVEVSKGSSRFSRSRKSVAEGSAGTVSVTTITDDPLQATLEDTPAADAAPGETKDASTTQAAEAEEKDGEDDVEEVDAAPKKKSAKTKKPAAEKEKKKSTTTKKVAAAPKKAATKGGKTKSTPTTKKKKASKK